MRIAETIKKQNLKTLTAFAIGLLILFSFLQSAIFHLEQNFHKKILEIWIGENKSRLSESVFVENTLALKSIIAKSPDLNEDLKLVRISIYNSSGDSLAGQNTQNHTEKNLINSKGFGFKTYLFPPKITYFSDLLFAGKNQGYLFVESYLSEKILFQNTAILILILFAFYIYYRFLQRKFHCLLNKDIIEPVLNLSNHMVTGEDIKVNKNKYEEFIILYSTYNEMISRIRTLSQEKEQKVRENVLYEITRQVAHDIRSPLSALNMVASTLDQVPEERRLLIRNAISRINDIANTLLQKSKSLNSQNSDPSSPQASAEPKLHLKTELLPALIDTIVSEKRMQFRNQIGVHIDVNLSSSYGAFAQVDSTELKRVMSNLINNSVEAFSNQKGQIAVVVKKLNESTKIIISDNGKGIPSHLLEQLGQVGVSHGKEHTASGSGLGIYHAKKTIERFGGQFQIESKEDQGTTITMTLPKINAPPWFTEKLIIDSKTRIISVDDDLSIHGLWRGRVQSLGAGSLGIEHLSFTSADEFKKWLHAGSQSKIKKNLFLVDYELLNQSQTGLDLIEELGISDQSLLVTSRYEEDNIKERCSRLNVRLIPKTMAGFVPIDVTNKSL